MSATNNLQTTRLRATVRLWTRCLLKTWWHGLAVVGLGAIIYLTCFDVVRITSGSMSPALIGEDWKSGDTVLVERVSYRFRQPRRWEVIAFRANGGARILKRVVGLPGESLLITRGGELYIDGQHIPRPEHLADLHYIRYGNLLSEEPVDCGEGYYVLGDDTKDSQDSRFEGPIPPDQILGRGWWILGPKERRGAVR